MYRLAVLFLLFQLFSFQNLFSAPVTKPDLNRISFSAMRNILNVSGLDGRCAEKILSIRNRRGEIRSFYELLEAGFSESEIGIIKTLFSIETTRKDPEEIIRDWNPKDPEFFYGLIVSPMDLNSAAAEHLKEIPVFGADGARKIISYRLTNEIGELLELTNAGIEKESLLRASPFVTLRPVTEKGFTLATDARYRFEQKNSFTNEAPENSDGMEFRTALDIRPVRFYFATASSGGIFSPTNSFYTDWYGRSRYFASLNSEFLDFVAGHYRLQFGRNLLFGPAFPSLSEEIGNIDTVKDDKGAAPCTSLTSDSDNNGARDYFNGAALALRLDRIDLFGYRPSPRITAFYSSFDSDAAGGFTNQTDYGADIRVGFLENSCLGFTAASQSRADGKFTGTGLGFRYDIAFPGLLEIYGEGASFHGMAVLQGADFKIGPWKMTALAFSAATNFDAPNASDIVHSHRDAYGFFSGLGFVWPGLEMEISADDQWKVSVPETKPRQSYRFSAGKKWVDVLEWMDIIEAGIRTKYSDNSFGITLRSFALCKMEFLGGSISAACEWQNLGNFTENETGNMLSVRVRFAVDGMAAAVFRWNGYSSDGYYSALYDVSEAVYPGDLSVKAYYGRGNEFSLVMKWEVSRGVTLDCGVCSDIRQDRGEWGAAVRTAFVF